MVSVFSHLKAGFLGGGVAAVINLCIFLLSRSLLDLQYLVPQGPEWDRAPIPPWAVVIFSIVPGLLAALLLWLLLKLLPTQAQRIFLGISLIILVASFALPIMAAEYIIEQTLLNIMHVIAAGSIIFALLKTVPASPSHATE
jgi:hypothetical protein